MKAARLYGKEDIRVEDVPLPELVEGELLLKVKAAFICGTDVRFYKNGNPGQKGEPLIIGHELSGVIEKVGPGVEFYREGERVGVAPNYGCGVCDHCTSGNAQLCRASEALGVTVDGAFAQYMRIPAAAVRQGNVALLSDSLTFEEAALAEPLSCVFNGYEKIGIYPGDHVLVLGAGPIGLMHARTAFLAGAAAVYITDLSIPRLDLARTLIPEIVAVAAGELRTVFPALTGGRLADVVVTAASSREIQEQAFSLAGINGRVLFFGGLPKGNSVVELDTNEIHYKQLTVAGTTRQNLRQYRDCLRLIDSGKLKVADLVTAVAPLDEVEAVIRDVVDGKGLKSAIKF